jgi:F-box-like
MLALSTYVPLSTTWEFVKQQAEKQRSQANNNDEHAAHKQPVSSIDGLLNELFLYIFSFFSPEDLGRPSCVCKKWTVLSSDNSLWDAFDLKKLFSSLKILDETVWETHVDLTALKLEVHDSPLLNKRTTIPVLKRLFASLGVEEKGVTLLTMPKGLTLNKLVSLGKSPKRGYPANFRFIWSRILEELGDAPVDKTYRVAITNSVLKGSAGVLIEDQQRLANEKGWKMPEFITNGRTQYSNVY